MEILKKYKPWAAKAQSWDYIENRYLTDFGNYHFRFVELVKHIKSSGLSNRLYGSTSMDKLVISIYEELDYRKEALHITFDLVQEKWHFEYFALPFQTPEFVRTYSADKGIEKLENFIKAINW
ncbi:hypothetical protein [Rhizosphaericola mali]|uniref:Uncharacterized protein n=1 Tax=Rhizosphaericola mali TaxID=2545455 RepID=A0A5P2GH11_9BACT|nr:hypothetical protein [Rhizosphaericola mali]QES91051.1 hypothetical protein E0W69_020265 [Rhizosphaericola mali]